MIVVEIRYESAAGVAVDSERRQKESDEFSLAPGARLLKDLSKPGSGGSVGNLQL
jgi:hypothetical protein